MKKTVFREIHCQTCKKILGRYNIKFYGEEKIGELLNTTYSIHVKSGHQISVKEFLKE